MNILLWRPLENRECKNFYIPFMTYPPKVNKLNTKSWGYATFADRKLTVVDIAAIIDKAETAV